MKAFRIKNDMVAARDQQEAIKAWAEHYDVPFNSAGPVEEIDPETCEIQIEEEDGGFRDGKLSEAMPPDGPACIVAFGEHEG